MILAGKTAFIVNPHAGNGATCMEWPRIQALARDRLGPFEVHLTSGPGDATRAAGEQLRRGFERIICVGGDGTLNEVVNGLVGEDGVVPAGVVVGFIPNGTGCDFVRTNPIPRKLDACLSLIEEGHARRLDLGRLTYRDPLGGTAVRYFHNIASFGIAGEVVARVNRTSKAFGPFVSFMWGTLLSLLLYGTKRVRLRLDDGPETECSVWNIAVANGRYHGGGMCVAPDAMTDDGLLHVTVIGDLRLPEVFWHLPKLYSRRIGDIRKVRMAVCRKAEASSGDSVLLDVDGEQPGTLPSRFEVVPAALNIIAG